MFALLALIAVQDRVPPPPDCSGSTGVGYAVGYQPAVPRQGETVELTAMVVPRYGMPPQPADPKCVDDWKVEGEGLKLLKGAKLQISAKAVPGATIRFSAQIGGIRGERGYGSFKVIAAGQKVLAGTFHVVSQEHCMLDDIAEMTFSAGGYYTYTRSEHMFETMTTGSGDYRLDQTSDRLELVRSDGVVWQAGTAVQRDGTVILDNIDPGGFMRDPPDQATAPVCHIVLR